MAVSIADFFVVYPEFSAERAPADLVQARLDGAAAELSVSAFGGSYSNAVCALAAHNIANSPWGQQARLVSDKGSTTYLTEYKRLQRGIVPRAAVL